VRTGSNLLMVYRPSPLNFIFIGAVQFIRDGISVHPAAPVTLKIPIPEAQRADAGSIEVHQLIPGTSSYAQLSPRVEGEYLVFETPYLF